MNWTTCLSSPDCFKAKKAIRHGTYLFELSNQSDLVSNLLLAHQSGLRVSLKSEPTSALDPISSRKIEEQFQELKKHYTIILVTHILRKAVRLADNAVFMYLGEVIEQGEPSVLFNNLQSEVLRNYLRDGH